MGWFLPSRFCQCAPQHPDLGSLGSDQNLWALQMMCGSQESPVTHRLQPLPPSLAPSSLASGQYLFPPGFNCQVILKFSGFQCFSLFAWRFLAGDLADAGLQAGRVPRQLGVPGCGCSLATGDEPLPLQSPVSLGCGVLPAAPAAKSGKRAVLRRRHAPRDTVPVEKCVLLTGKG